MKRSTALVTFGAFAAASLQVLGAGAAPKDGNAAAAAWKWETNGSQGTVIADLDQPRDIVIWVTDMDRGIAPVRFDVGYPDACCRGLDTMHNVSLPNWQLFSARKVTFDAIVKDGDLAAGTAATPKPVKGWACIYPLGEAPEKPTLQDCMKIEGRKS